VGLLLVIAHTLILVAALALFGQGIVGVFNWPRRRQNLVYRLFEVIASPVVKLIRLITPRIVLDQHIPIAAFMVLLSEFASNTAAAALLVPVFAAIAAPLGLPSETLVVLVALAASCGFALPVATPPNALVYGTGQMRQCDMLRAGGGLDVVCVLVLAAWGLLSLWR